MSRFVLVCCLFLALLGCGDTKAKELFDTAQLEERQYNAAHAQELYREIVTRFPDSPYADQARDRLAALKNP